MDEQAPIPDNLRVAQAREALAGSTPANAPDALAAANPTRSVLATETDLTTKREFLWNVHTYTNNYIQFADTKAAFCVGIASALMAALFASKAHELFIRNAPSQYAGHRTILAGVSLAAFVLLAMSMGAAVMVVWPRPWKYSKNSFIFWDDIVKNFSTAASFAAQYSAQTDAELTLCLSQHLYSLAKVCHRKFFWVSVATVAAAIGGALAVIVLLFKR
jgi:hypothetical protein